MKGRKKREKRRELARSRRSRSLESTRANHVDTSRRVHDNWIGQMWKVFSWSRYQKRRLPFLVKIKASLGPQDKSFTRKKGRYARVRATATSRVMGDDALTVLNILKKIAVCQRLWRERGIIDPALSNRKCQIVSDRGVAGCRTGNSWTNPIGRTRRTRKARLVDEIEERDQDKSVRVNPPSRRAESRDSCGEI